MKTRRATCQRLPIPSSLDLWAIGLPAIDTIHQVGAGWEYVFVTVDNPSSVAFTGLYCIGRPGRWRRGEGRQPSRCATNTTSCGMFASTGWRLAGDVAFSFHGPLEDETAEAPGAAPRRHAKCWEGVDEVWNA